MFDVETLVSAVYQVVLFPADNQKLDDTSHPFGLFDLGNNTLTMSGAGHAVISAPDALALDQAVLKVFALFYFWLGQPQAKALPNRHDAWKDQRKPLTTELERISGQRVILSVRRCQVCRPTRRQARRQA